MPSASGNRGTSGTTSTLHGTRRRIRLGARKPVAHGNRRITATFVAWAAALLLATLLGATPLRDPLCHAIARPQGYACTAARLLTADVLRPGDLIDRAGGRSGALDSPACRIPGAAPLPLPVTTSAIASRAQRITYSALGSLGRDGQLDAPLPSGPVIALDGQWDGLRRVDVTIGGLSRASIDTAAALQNLASCAIRTRCVDDLRSGQTRLVTGTLVTAAAQYALRDAKGVPRAAFTDRLPTAGTRSIGSGEVQANDPLVIGTQSLDPASLAAPQMCAASVGREASGTVEAAVSGHGNRGAFGDQYVKQPLGTIAQLFAQGTEVSDCDADLGREKSRGYAQAQLEQTDGGLRLVGEIRATSGRYRVGRCTVGRRLPTNNTVANSAMARVHVVGALDLLVRYEQMVDIDLRWTGAPPGTTLRVLAPDGHALIADQIIQGEGSQGLRVPGPGVFHVLPTIDARLERKGESGVKSSSFNATVEAVVTPVRAPAGATGAG